jgi:ketosteroid isomerase-like protein
MSTEDALAAFSAAFGSGDVEAIMALMTDDVVFESTAPPDGERAAGAAEVRRVWERLFGETPGAAFTEEDRFTCGDRGVLRWRFSWAGEQPGHIRGVDIVTFRDGKVAEKLSYVKG